MLAHHFITEALSEYDALMAAIGGRLFNWPNDDVMAGTATVPYIVVKANGFKNDEGTKDDAYDSLTDIDSVLVTFVAETDKAICSIGNLVRDAVAAYSLAVEGREEELGLEFRVEDYNVSGNGINYDEITTARSMTLTFTITNTSIE